ncbi:hypothetical protein RUND412_001936 [Rhizina undulata]
MSVPRLKTVEVVLLMVVVLRTMPSIRTTKREDTDMKTEHKLKLIPWFVLNRPRMPDAHAEVPKLVADPFD